MVMTSLTVSFSMVQPIARCDHEITIEHATHIINAAHIALSYAVHLLKLSVINCYPSTMTLIKMITYVAKTSEIIWCGH